MDLKRMLAAFKTAQECEAAVAALLRKAEKLRDEQEAEKQLRITITDHARVQWIRHFMGVDLNRLDRAILPPHVEEEALRNQHRKHRTFSTSCPRLRLRLKGRAVVSVEPQEKP